MEFLFGFDLFSSGLQYTIQKGITLKPLCKPYLGLVLGWGGIEEGIFAFHDSGLI